MPSGTRSCSSRSARSALAFAGTNPKRRATRREGRAERRERPVGVHVARMLAQDGEDQLVERIARTRWRQLAEAAFESPEDRSDTPRRRVRVRHRPGWYGTLLTRTDRVPRCGTASATARS